MKGSHEVMDFVYNNQSVSMYEVENLPKDLCLSFINFLQAAIDGDEQYFNTWLSIMQKNGLSVTTIKSKIEKLDHEQYSALHYTIRYNHLNLSQKLVEQFHCGIQYTNVSNFF